MPRSIRCRTAVVLALVILAGCSSERELPISSGAAPRGASAGLSLADRGGLSNPLKVVGKAKRQLARGGGRISP